MEDFFKGFFMFLFSEHKYKQKIAFFMQVLKLVASIYSSRMIYESWYGKHQLDLDFSNVIGYLCSYQFIISLLIFGFYFFIFYDSLVILCGTIYTQFFSPIRRYPFIKRLLEGEIGKKVVHTGLLKSKIDKMFNIIENEDKVQLGKDFTLNVFTTERDIVKYFTYLTIIVSQLPIDWTFKLPFWAIFILIFLLMPKVVGFFESAFESFSEILNNQNIGDKEHISN